MISKKDRNDWMSLKQQVLFYEELLDKGVILPNGYAANRLKMLKMKKHHFNNWIKLTQDEKSSLINNT